MEEVDFAWTCIETSRIKNCPYNYFFHSLDRNYKNVLDIHKYTFVGISGLKSILFTKPGTDEDTIK